MHPGRSRTPPRPDRAGRVVRRGLEERGSQPPEPPAISSKSTDLLRLCQAESRKQPDGLEPVPSCSGPHGARCGATRSRPAPHRRPRWRTRRRRRSRTSPRRRRTTGRRDRARREWRSAGRCPPRNDVVAEETSRILVVRQAELMIGAWRPDVVTASTRSNCTAPKSVSGRVLQLLELVQFDGASAIHSAEVMSIVWSTIVFVNVSRAVRSVMTDRHVVPVDGSPMRRSRRPGRSSCGSPEPGPEQARTRPRAPRFRRRSSPVRSPPARARWTSGCSRRSPPRTPSRSLFPRHRWTRAGPRCRSRCGMSHRNRAPHTRTSCRW